MSEQDPAITEPQRIERISVPELDAILGVPFYLQGGGFIRLIDYMGSDASIVQAARVSYGAGTKRVSEDRGLIRFLLRHRHTTPFEMCDLKIHVRVAMDTWRQWIRHRTSSVNEYSTRYSIAIDEAHMTDKGDWRVQAGGNRQGSDGFLSAEDGAHLSRREAQLHDLSREVYNERLEHDVAREQARKDLPLSTLTEAYWKINLHNLLHFLGLRMDRHAQLEIREYADIIGNEIVARWVPTAWEAFNDYHPHMGALALTRLEKEIVAALCASGKGAAIEVARSFGWLEEASPGTLKKNRERSEAEEKIKGLGLTVPWLTAA